MTQSMRLLGIILVAGLLLASPSLAKKAIVTDLDQTLGSYTVCYKIFGVSLYCPKPYTNSPQVFRDFAANGYSVLYLSCKVSWQQSSQQTWLTTYQFPAGVNLAIGGLFGCTDTVKQKCDTIKSYTAQGWEFHFGFSEAQSNMDAYKCAGVHHPTQVANSNWWTTVSYRSLEAGHTI